MITGWLSSPVGANGRFLPAMLPEPHRAYYRDGGPVADRATAGASLTVRQVDANEVHLTAGANTSGGMALEVEIVKREVFHGILVDRIEIDFGWQPCEGPPDTAWESC